MQGKGRKWNWLSGEYLFDERWDATPFLLKSINWREEGEDCVWIAVGCNDFGFAKEVEEIVREFYEKWLKGDPRSVFDLLKEISERVKKKYNIEKPEYDLLLYSSEGFLKIWFTIN
ncbi:MAG: hypothetical protein QXU69_10845 [Thermofilaceae archaeon]